MEIIEMILSNLLFDPEFAARVLPCLRTEFMETEEHGVLLDIIQTHVEEYDVVPTPDALIMHMHAHEKVRAGGDEFRDKVGKAFGYCANQHLCRDDSIDFRINTAEKHCKRVVCRNASFKVAELSNTPERMDEAQAILEEATAFSFDLSLGYDVRRDAGKTYDRLHEKRIVMSTGNSHLDSALGGGWEDIALYVYLGGTGVGKSTKLIDDAAKLSESGKNGVYVTTELQDFKVSTRFMANMFDIEAGKLKERDQDFTINRDAFVQRTDEMMANRGQLRIMQDLSGECNVHKIRAFLRNLKVREGFVPDYIIVDHLSKLQSVRLNRKKSNVRGDEVLGSIAYELRNLSGSIGAPVITAEQTKRESDGKLVLSLDDIAGGYSIAREADGIIGIGEDAEYLEKGLWMYTMLKLRETGQKNSTFEVGINKDKQRTHEVDSQPVKRQVDTKGGNNKVLSASDFDYSSVVGAGNIGGAVPNSGVTF